jgi:formate hydrogenlyase subunit 6/NADH:ubiquinone oxidoreductase subunit I
MLKDVFLSLFKRPFTERYPYTVRPAPARLRGKLLWEEGKCKGCMLCVRDCPARAIEIAAADKTGQKTVLHYQAGAIKIAAADTAARKYVFHYHIDRCIYCAQCVVSCKENALSMSSVLYHLASTDKATFTEVYRSEGEGACAEGEEGR